MRRSAIERQLATRPRPPAHMLELDAPSLFLPAPELLDWVWNNILVPDGPLYNPDHRHLQEATLGFLWTNVVNTRQGVRVGGTCETPKPINGNAWQKARVLYQVEQWFGEIPDFIITLDAWYAAGAPDASFCGTTEHELYHAGQALDEFGMPKFTKDGRPKFTLRPHDAEEFVGVVRRYGVGASARGVAELVEAGSRAPEIAAARIEAACGTCGRRTG